MVSKKIYATCENLEFRTQNYRVQQKFVYEFIVFICNDILYFEYLIRTVNKIIIKITSKQFFYNYT